MALGSGGFEGGHWVLGRWVQNYVELFLRPYRYAPGRFELGRW